MKHKKKIAIAAVSLAALIGVGALAGFTTSGNSSTGTIDATGVRTVTLQRGSLASSVNVTGMVYSKNATEVYSGLAYSVETVNVSVGDPVSAGDVLAVLDTRALEADIAQKQAAVGTASAKAQQSLAEAQKALNTYENNASNGYNSSLVNAESTIATAELDVQTAELSVQAAGNEVQTARRKLRDARQNEGDFEDMDATDSQKDALRDAMVGKETMLEKAQTELEKAKTRLEQAKTGLDMTKVTTQDSLSDYQDRVKSAQLSTNFSDQQLYIQKLQGDLEKSTIISPVSGIVTEVNAVEGGSGSGRLFVIQDGDGLKIVANIKEYDIDTVSINDKVIIKADATGDREYTGILTKISPTSNATAAGNITSSTDSEYESEITVSSTQAGLRIGMNARLSIITEEKDDTYAVPYEAIVDGEDGISYVYALYPTDKGKAKVEMIPVTKGLQSNLTVEIIGEGLSDGLTIVKNAMSIDQTKATPASAPQTEEQAPAAESAANDVETDSTSNAADTEDTTDQTEAEDTADQAEADSDASNQNPDQTDDTEGN